MFLEFCFAGSTILFTSEPKVSDISLSLYPSTLEYENNPLLAIPFICTSNDFASYPSFSTITLIGATNEEISLYNSKSVLTTKVASCSSSFL